MPGGLIDVDGVFKDRQAVFGKNKGVQVAELIEVVVHPV